MADRFPSTRKDYAWLAVVAVLFVGVLVFVQCAKRYQVLPLTAIAVPKKEAYVLDLQVDRIRAALILECDSVRAKLKPPYNAEHTKWCAASNHHTKGNAPQ